MYGTLPVGVHPYSVVVVFTNPAEESTSYETSISLPLYLGSTITETSSTKILDLPDSELSISNNNSIEIRKLNNFNSYLEVLSQDKIVEKHSTNLINTFLRGEAEVSARKLVLAQIANSTVLSISYSVVKNAFKNIATNVDFRIDTLGKKNTITSTQESINISNNIYGYTLTQQNIVSIGSGLNINSVIFGTKNILLPAESSTLTFFSEEFEVRKDSETDIVSYFNSLSNILEVYKNLPVNSIHSEFTTLSSARGRNDNQATPSKKFTYYYSATTTLVSTGTSQGKEVYATDTTSQRLYSGNSTNY